MRIRMRTAVAGPHFQAHAGQELDIAEEHAKPLVESGHAVYVQPAVPAIEDEVEETIDEETEETEGDETEDETTDAQGAEGEEPEATVTQTTENAMAKKARPKAKAKRAGK